MKNIFKFTGFCFFIAFLIFGGCYSCKGQVPHSPTYTGDLTDKVFIPAVFQGKPYKITADRFSGGGYINPDSLIDSPATVTKNVPSGQLTIVYARNGYGLVTFTNNTGAPFGSTVEIKVAYSLPSTRKPTPVISFMYMGAGVYSRLAIYTPNIDGFIVKLMDDIPNGESISFTYNIHGY